MQYNFLGFSVSKMMELNLDMKDIAILRYFIDFRETGRMNYEIVEGEKYYWINYSSVENEMPHIRLGKRAIMLRMLKLRDLGILVHYTKKEGGTYSFYNLGSKYNELINKNKTTKNKDEFNICENKESYEKKEGYENKDKYRYKFSKGKNSFLDVKEEIENKDIQGKWDKQSREKEEVKQEVKEDKMCKKYQRNNQDIGMKEHINFSRFKENSVQEKEQYLYEISKYVQNYTQGVHGNEEELCTNMFKGCVSKGRTKTLLLNNSSTKETNIKKYIKKEVEEIVEYLNYMVGANYKPTFKNTIKLIDARLTEGFTAYDFKTVIDKKVKDWTGTEYEKYLTPGTLFGDKFEKYLNQKVVSDKTRYKNNYEPPKLRFNNFTGREYDYDELEKKLLGW